jgi:hypothetical protein
VTNDTTLPDPLPVQTYIEDGARIAAILLVWGILAAVATFVLGNVGGPGSPFPVVGTWLGSILFAVGFLNALLYVVYRGIDYWRA